MPLCHRLGRLPIVRRAGVGLTFRRRRASIRFVVRCVRRGRALGPLFRHPGGPGSGLALAAAFGAGFFLAESPGAAEARGFTNPTRVSGVRGFPGDFASSGVFACPGALASGGAVRLAPGLLSSLGRISAAGPARAILP